MNESRTDARDDFVSTPCLAGLRVAFSGRFASMTQREAEALAEQHGGVSTGNVSARTDLLVVGEGEWPLVAGGQVPRNLQAAIDLKERASGIEILRETEWLARLGVLEGQGDVHRHYTPAMLARILGVAPRTVAGWIRRGLIRPVRHVYRLAYFDFQEAASAKRLAELIESGVSPATIERALGSLERWLPEVKRPLSQLALLAEGNEVLSRHGRHLVEPSGQRRFDFEPHEHDDAETTEDDSDDAAAREPQSVAALCELAGELEEQEDLAGAIDAYRKALLLGGPHAEIAFRVGNLLYQLGEVNAARERFYEAVQTDADYVEAWNILGCVLAELDQTDEAIEAFECALAVHEDYADAHYHLADVLEARGRHAEAAEHWQAYLRHDGRSTWADEARRRLETAEGVP